MNRLSSLIDAGARFRNPLADVEDGLFLNVGDKRAKYSQFWMLLVLASLIAAGGVVGDSTPAVIGAMIIAPLATPIYGVALATVVGSRRGLIGAVWLLVTGILVNIAIGVVAGFIFVASMPLDTNPQITGRTSPTLLDLTVAVATGVAGAFALTRRDVSNILAGVAIAISLVPVLAVVGITLGAGRFDLASGAMVLFLTNVAAILVAGVVVFGAARYYQESADRDVRVGRRAKVFIVVLLVALVIPLTLTSIQTRRHDRWLSATQTAAEQWARGTPWQVGSVTSEGSDIVVRVIGHGAPPSIKALRAAVRRSVPAGVPVQVIEGYGLTSSL